jgi:hypothetical protein
LNTIIHLPDGALSALYFAALVRNLQAAAPSMILTDVDFFGNGRRLDRVAECLNWWANRVTLQVGDPAQMRIN